MEQVVRRERVPAQLWDPVARVAAVAGAYGLVRILLHWATAESRPDLTELTPQLLVELAAGILVALTLGPLALRMSGPRSRALAALTLVLFLSLMAVTIEGAAFAPDTVPLASLPVAIATELAVALLAVAVIVALFAPRSSRAAPEVPRRSWLSWLWRYLASAVAYVALYFVTGAVNYVLFTRPYYESHAAGLVVPETGIVLLVCVIEAAMYPVAVLPLLYALPGSRRDRALAAGLALFVLGGLVPLLVAAPLPVFLRIASAWEILAQKFPVGVVSALLLGPASAERRGAAVGGDDDD